MADVDPPRECNPLCAVGRLSGGRGGGMPWVGATLCTFPAFSLVPKNAMVDNPHGGPHLLTLRSCVSGSPARPDFTGSTPPAWNRRGDGPSCLGEGSCSYPGSDRTAPARRPHSPGSTSPAQTRRGDGPSCFAGGSGSHPRARRPPPASRLPCRARAPPGLFRPGNPGSLAFDLPATPPQGPYPTRATLTRPHGIPSLRVEIPQHNVPRPHGRTVEGQLCLGRFSKGVGSCACLFYVLSFTLLCFNCHLYMADGCTGGGRRTGARGPFL